MPGDPGSTTAQYVANSLTLPSGRDKFAFDLNGDQTLDNQLGGILGALAAQIPNLQMTVDDAVKSGSVIILMEETSKDATFRNDSATGVIVAKGSTVTAPVFDGSGNFTVDPAFASINALFKGKIVAGKYTSNNPAVTTSPVSLTLDVPLIQGQAPLELNIVGGRITFTSDSGQLMSGQINGAVRASDVRQKIVPLAANLLTTNVASDPMAMKSSTQQILSIFDKGGTPDPACNGTCKNDAGDRVGQCAVSGDKIIDECEVATNSLLQNALAPDVQLFSDDGSTYHPNPDNKHKDSLSLGLGFTAVGAHFQ
jgi:hypothetical protein